MARMQSAFARAPGPAFGGPERLVRVAAGFDERQEPRPRNRRAIDREGVDEALGGGQFVVEREPPRVRSELPHARRHGPFARRRAALRRPRQQCRPEVDAELLCHELPGLAVHVFMEQHEAEEVQRVVGRRAVAQQRKRRRAHRREVGAGRVGRGQRELPALRVLYGRGVVQRIGIGPHGRQAGGIRVTACAVPAGRVASHPVFLEPADVSEFPERQIQHRVVRDAQAFGAERALETVEQGQQALPARSQRRLQFGQAGVTHALGVA